jgi:PAS domain S-box-containing protein
MDQTSGINILHVDDKPDFAALTADMLEREADPFTVKTATSASEGLDRLAADDFDCIVSDYDMSQRNGIEFLETVREEYPDLPFILYTGKGSEEVAGDAIAAGATDYIQKDSGSEHYELLANRVQNAVEQSQAEKQVAEAEQRIRTIAEHADDILWNFTADWTDVLFVNSAYEETFGGSIDELRASPKSFLDNVHPEDVAEVKHAMDRLSAGDSVSLEYRITTEKDSTRWVWMEGDPVYADDGEVKQVVGSAKDITEHKQREQALAALHDTVQDLIDAADTQTVADLAAETARTVLDQPINGIWLYDPDDNILEPVSMTDDARELLGEQPTYTPGESLTWQAFDDNEFLIYDDISTESERLNPDTPIRSEIIVPLGGHGAMNIGSTEPAQFSDTDIWLARIFGRAVEAALTRAKREQKVRSQRSELQRQNDRLEKFTSVVSHDLRNPLAVANGRLELAQRECDSAHLDAVAQAHERMETLIDDVLTLAREGEPVEEPEPVDLGDTIDGCWRNIERNEATLVTETKRTVRAEPSRLKQLLENLFRNAVEHGGETVRVTVGSLDNGFYVADDGPGIPDGERDEVFEAGYSTADEGTGFGLNIVQKIAEAHGWEVSVTDSDTGGARFEITGVETAAE